MSAKRCWPLALVVSLLAGTGCCRLCERWCGDNHYSAVLPSRAVPRCRSVARPARPW